MVHRGETPENCFANSRLRDSNRCVASLSWTQCIPPLVVSCVIRRVRPTNSKFRVSCMTDHDVTWYEELIALFAQSKKPYNLYMVHPQGLEPWTH